MTTSKTVKGLVAAAFTALLLTGCASGTETTEPTGTTTPATTTTSETTSSTSSSPPPPAPETEEPAPVAPAPAAAPAPVAAPVYTPPTFLYCYLADGTAMMSDGTTTYMDSCNESAGGPYLLEDGRSIYDLPQYDDVDWEADRAWSDCIQAGGTSETCAG